MFPGRDGKYIGLDMIRVCSRRILKDPANKGATIVTTSASSHVLSRPITRRWARAARRIAWGMRSIKDDGGEGSLGGIFGAYLFRDNFYADSAAIAFANLLVGASGAGGLAEASLDPSVLQVQSRSGRSTFRSSQDAKTRELADHYKRCRSITSTA